MDTIASMLAEITKNEQMFRELVRSVTEPVARIASMQRLYAEESAKFQALRAEWLAEERRRSEAMAAIVRPAYREALSPGALPPSLVQWEAPFIEPLSRPASARRLKALEEQVSELQAKVDALTPPEPPADEGDDDPGPYTGVYL